MPPSIQKRKALINRLGVVILSKTKLVLEVHLKGTKLVSVGATYHEGANVFIVDGFDSLCLFGIGKILGIADDSIPLHVRQHCIKKGKDSSNSTTATICFDGLDVGKEIAVVGMVVDSVFLVVGEVHIDSGTLGIEFFLERTLLEFNQAGTRLN